MTYIRASAREGGRDVKIDPPDTMVLTTSGWVNEKAARKLRLRRVDEIEAPPMELEAA